MIYEVVSGGKKEHDSCGGEDWSVLVAAITPSQARDLALEETDIDCPWIVYEWGQDTRESPSPGILRGPIETSPADCRGWKSYIEDTESSLSPPPMIECRNSGF